MTAPEYLPHAVEECIGEWSRDREGEPWACSACGRVHPASTENDRASHLEFLAGVTLRNEAGLHRLKGMAQEQPPARAIELDDEERQPWE